MRSTTVTLWIWICLWILALAPAPGNAQAPPPPQPSRELPALSGFSVVPFNFGPPGARSLGMGGTFIALADDATAAEANPAGLTQLSRPEVSVHGRSSSFKVEALDFNAVTALEALNVARDSGPPLFPGSQVGNAFAGEVRTVFDPTVTEVSFASYVKPYDTYTFSVFFQRSADFAGETRFEAFDDSLLDLYQTRQVFDLALENAGVSAAFKAGDHLSVGFSVRYSRLTLDALQETRADYLADLELELLPRGSSLEQVRALDILDQRTSREVFDSSASDVTFNAGLLFNPGGGRWSFGLVYKDGGSFDLGGATVDFNGLAAAAMGNLGCNPGEPQPTRQRVDVPDFLGLGITWRAGDRLKLALDANSITYSDLNAGLGTMGGRAVRDQFERIDDELEVHFGAELLFFLGSRRQPLTLRAGVYTVPDRDGFTDLDSEDTAITFGLGTVLMESVQIDLAAQASDAADAGILSLVYRF